MRNVFGGSLGGMPKAKCTVKQFKAQYKRAVRELVQDMGYSTTNKVPKHMRVALRSNANRLASVRCGTAKTWR